MIDVDNSMLNMILLELFSKRFDLCSEFKWNESPVQPWEEVIVRAWWYRWKQDVPNKLIGYIERRERNPTEDRINIDEYEIK